jgi:hypothetical protein
MKQMLTLFLVCQPAAILLSATMTFWPAIRLSFDHPKIAWHVAGMIWSDLTQDSRYWAIRSEDGHTMIQVIAR